MRCPEICHHTGPEHKRPRPVPARVKVTSRSKERRYHATAERLCRRRRVYFPQKPQGWIYLSYEGIGTVNRLLWNYQSARVLVEVEVCEHRRVWSWVHTLKNIPNSSFVKLVWKYNAFYRHTQFFRSTMEYYVDIEYSTVICIMVCDVTSIS